MSGRAALLLCILCVALQVHPESVTIDKPVGNDFETVFTLTNNAARPITLQITPDPYSAYLADAARLSQERVALRPQESVNIQVRGTIPPLGPETHRLRYRIAEEELTVGAFLIRIPIEGNPLLAPRIRVESRDVTRDEPVLATVTLANYGNVIAYYNLSLSVRDDTDVHGTLSYPRLEQVLPGEEQLVTLLYTDRLEPGMYALTVEGYVNGIERVSAEHSFRVLLEHQERVQYVGEDMLLTLAGTGPQTVEYVVRTAGAEVLRDVITGLQDEVPIPTATLPPGRYEVELRVTHSLGTDTTTVSLRIEERRVWGGWWVLVLVIVGGVASAVAKPLLLRFRIARLEHRIRMQEKRLKELIRRAHALTHDA